MNNEFDVAHNGKETAENLVTMVRVTMLLMAKENDLNTEDTGIKDLKSVV